MVANGERPKIKDVAVAAGVSVGTVSNVLRDLPSVNPEIRKRVLKVIAEEGYVRNRGAALLRSKSQGVFGSIVYDITNPIAAELVHGVRDEAEVHGHSLIIATSAESPEVERANLKLFEELRLTGVIIAPIARMNIELIETINNRGTPIVLVGDNLRSKFPTVSTGNAFGAEMAAQHIVKMGRTKILFVSAALNNIGLKERYDTTVQVLKKYPGVNFEFLEVPFQNQESGTIAAQHISKLPKAKRPDAIIAGNDLIALGILEILHGTEIQIPRDIAIIGYDDIAAARISVVGLTTIRQDIYKTGTAAVKLLSEIVAHPTAKPPASIKLVPELIVRSTT